MFQNICILGFFISPLLIFNNFWKKSCITNTSSDYIEPSIMAGILITGLSYIMHMLLLPTEYQASYSLINPYMIIGMTTVIYHSIRRYLEIVKKTDGSSKHPILWGLQIMDPVFVNYISIRLFLVQLIYHISSTEYVFNIFTNIVFSLLFGSLYYCKYSRRYCTFISSISGLGIALNATYEIIYRTEWYLRYNYAVLSVVYALLIYEWGNNRLLNKKRHRGNTYPVISMYISDITAAFLIYRGNYNYLEYIDNSTF